MGRTLWLVILGIALLGCGTEKDDAPLTVDNDGDDTDWADYADDDIDDVETGAFSTNLPGEAGVSEALCDLIITRVVDQSMATIMLNLDVIGEGCDVTGRCDDPEKRNGDINYNGGIEADKPFATMVLGYEPPSDPKVQSMWMYNAVFKAEPYSRFEMQVDGEQFDILTSDIRGADNFATGPHVWRTRIDIEADMLKSGDDTDSASPKAQVLGKFSYEGNCEVSVKKLSLQ